MGRVLAVACALALVVGAACSSNDGKDAASPPTTLKVWVTWTGDDAKHFGEVIDRFEAANPGVKVQVTGGMDDETKLVAAIRAGKAPDVLGSYHQENLGKFCGSGTYEDLGKREAADHVTAALFPPAAKPVFDYRGGHCAIPYGADARALYYNTDLLKAAGYEAPPKTISELVAMTKKLTQRNADGTIKVAGFVPLFDFYENYVVELDGTYPVTYFDKAGKSNLATDPSWHDLLTWQKGLVDWYGKDQLTAFTAAAGQEFSASNAFETGQIAMQLDGEWRTLLISKDHPELHYATAPFPAPDDHPEYYGAGSVSPSFLAVPKGSQHAAEAWKLIKFLALDTHNVATFFSALHNIPTTKAALASKEFDAGPNFGVFLTQFANPLSKFPVIIPEGSVYFDPITNFVESWQTGGVADLDAGLRAVDAQIDAAVAQARG